MSFPSDQVTDIMVESHGGETGGLSINDALREYESRGYSGQFAAREGGLVECLSCSHQMTPEVVPLESMRRVEGASDPADMCVISALECPECHAMGTATFCYGPGATAEDAEVLRRLEDLRPSHAASVRSGDDASMVRDSGWLRHEDEG